MTLNFLAHTDIICISETFLKPHYPHNIATIDNFSIERCDRQPNSHKLQGGGAAILIRDNLLYKHLDTPTEILKSVCYSVWLEVSTQTFKPLIVATIYRAPDSDKSSFVELLHDAVNEVSSITTDTVIMGDKHKLERELSG